MRCRHFSCAALSQACKWTRLNEKQRGLLCTWARMINHINAYWCLAFLCQALTFSRGILNMEMHNRWTFALNIFSLFKFWHSDHSLKNLWLYDHVMHWSMTCIRKAPLFFFFYSTLRNTSSQALQGRSWQSLCQSRLGKDYTMIVFFRATLLLSKRLHCSGKGMLLASAGRTSTDRTIALSALWEAFIMPQ